jgi:hypothetical protein
VAGGTFSCRNEKTAENKSLEKKNVEEEGSKGGGGGGCDGGGEVKRC